MDLPDITAVHYCRDGVWSGQARCRAGHTLALPAEDQARWQHEHAACALARNASARPAAAGAGS